MRRLISCTALAFLGVFLAGCHSGEVRLQVFPESNRHEWRKLLSADEFSAPVRNLFYAVEPPVGYAEARLHPLEGFALSARMRWNAVVRSLLDDFDELRVQHNKAETTIKEFDERHGVLLAVAKELGKKKTALDAALEDYSAAKGELAGEPTGEGELSPQAASGPRKRMEQAQARGEQVLKDALECVGALDAP